MFFISKSNNGNNSEFIMWVSYIRYITVQIIWKTKYVSFIDFYWVVPKQQEKNVVFMYMSMSISMTSKDVFVLKVKESEL